MDGTLLLTTYYARRSSAHHVEVEVRECVVKEDAAIDAKSSSVDSAEDVDARMCTIIPR